MGSAFANLKARGPRALRSAAQSVFRGPRGAGNVLMLHNGRSGSTLLGDMLDQHQDIFWDGETLEKKLHRIQGQRKCGFAELYGSFNLDDGVDEISRRLDRRAAGRIFGTEIQDYHVEIMETDVESFLGRLKDLGFDRFIFLERNYLRKIVSHIIATQRRAFHINAGENVSHHKIHIDPDCVYVGHRQTTLLKVFCQYRQFFQRAQDAVAGSESLHLRYEDDLQTDPGIAVGRVCQFLGVTAHKPVIKFGKTTDMPLKDLIDNFDQIIDLVLDSEFHAEAENMLSLA